MYSILKRLFDIVFGFVLLFFTFPIFLITSIMIKMEDPKGTVLHKARRIGYMNKEFTVFKFRSMKVENKKNDKILNDNERLLKCGKFIRKYSFDELPQIFNVIKGEMSFIGPRPLPIKYFDYLTDEEFLRHNVRPGISGLSQVNGRNFLSWDEKFKLDINYAQNFCLTLDIKIFLLTLKNIFIKQNVGIQGIDIEIKSLYDVRDKVIR